MASSEPIKIAIIGSGIAGLSMAYYLSHPEQEGKFEVTIYESHHRLGLDSQSILFTGDGFADGTFVEDNNLERIDGVEKPNFVSWLSDKKEKAVAAASSSRARPGNVPSTTPTPVPTPQPNTNIKDEKKYRVRIDMPLRVFSTRYYPHLTTLLESLGVKYQCENYEASFSEYNGAPIFKYQNLLLGSFSIPYVNPSDLFKPVTRDIIRFLNCAPKDLRNGRLQPPPGLLTTFDLLNSTARPLTNPIATTTATATPQHETLLEYLVTEGYSEEFIYHFEIPTVASICTCSYESAAKYPAYIIIQYQVLRSGGGVRRVKSGMNNVVAGLSQYVKQVKTGTAVTALRYLEANHCPTLNLSTIPPPAFKPTATDPTDCRSPGSPIKNENCTDHIEVSDSNGNRDIFDHVIFSTQANQTCKILHRTLFGPPATPPIVPATLLDPPTNPIFNASTSPKNKPNIDPNATAIPQLQPAPRNWYKMYDALAQIPYESSELILHGDERFLPPSKSNWANCNFLLPSLDSVKQYVHTPEQYTPQDLTPEVTDGGLNSPADSQESYLGPMIAGNDNDSEANSDTSLLSNEPLLIPSHFLSPAQGHARLGSHPSSPNSLSTDLSAPNLCRQFSENWLQQIERQPSARAQRHALVMNTKMVSQEEGMSTIWMNKVQDGLNPSRNIFQTWNPFVGIIHYAGNNLTEIMEEKTEAESRGEGQIFNAPKTMGQLIETRAKENFGTENVKDLYGRSFFQRPVVTFDSINACRDLWELNGKANIWSIGSFSLGGVPLLESGVASAFVVGQKLGAKAVMKPTETVKESQYVPPAPVGRDANDIANRNATTTNYPILGWVNNASSTNKLVEFVIWLVYNLLFICGAYRTDVDPKSLYPHNKKNKSKSTKQD